MLKPIKAPKNPKPGDFRVSKVTDAARMVECGALYRPYQVDEFVGPGLGWFPRSVHETYREAVAAKRAA